MNLAAVRINSFAASLIGSMGGRYIKYSEIAWNEPGMFNADTVNLSELGNDIFVHHLQSALQHLMGEYF
jgi:hypothetical protein